MPVLRLSVPSVSSVLYNLSIVYTLSALSASSVTCLLFVPGLSTLSMSSVFYDLSAIYVFSALSTSSIACSICVFYGLSAVYAWTVCFVYIFHSLLFMPRLSALSISFVFCSLSTVYTLSAPSASFVTCLLYLCLCLGCLLYLHLPFFVACLLSILRPLYLYLL